jgi:hypothetical protein
MKIANNFLLAISAYTSHFLATESYSLKPLRPSPSARSSSAYGSPYQLDRVHTNSLGQLSISRNLCSYSNKREDNLVPTIPVERSLSTKIFKKFQRSIAGIVTALLLCFVGARGAVAKPSRSSSSNSPQKTVVKQKSNGKVATTKKASNKKVEVELVVEDETDKKDKITNFGFILVAVSTVATLLSGDDKEKMKKNSSSKLKKSPVQPSPRVATFRNTDDDEEGEEDSLIRRKSLKSSMGSGDISNKLKKGTNFRSSDDDDDEEEEEGKPIKREILKSNKLKKSKGSMNFLPPKVELTSDVEETSGIFEKEDKGREEVSIEKPTPQSSQLFEPKKEPEVELKVEKKKNKLKVGIYVQYCKYLLLTSLN